MFDVVAVLAGSLGVGIFDALYNSSQARRLIPVKLLDQILDLGFGRQDRFYLLLSRVEPDGIKGGMIQRVGHRQDELVIFHGDRYEPAFAHELDRKRVLKNGDLRQLLGRHVADPEMLAQVAHHFTFRQGADIYEQFADPLPRLFLKIQSGVQLFLRHRAFLEKVLPEELLDSQVFKSDHR